MSTAAEALLFNAGQVHPMRGLRFPSSKTVTANTTLTNSDPRRIRLDATAAAFTLTLPVVGDGEMFYLQEIAGLATPITVVDVNGLLINGAGSLTMNAPNRERWIMFDSALVAGAGGWRVIGSAN